MALATQCPHCHTTFKVAHDQLKLRAGLVRCGACKQIFNGVEHLVPPDQLTATAAGPKPSTASSSQPAGPSAPEQPAAPVSVAPRSDISVASDNAVATPTDAPMDALEFAPNDDPETQTRILAPEPEEPVPALAHQPRRMPDDDDEEDPLTRMTLVDFSAFEDDEPSEVAPAKPAATALDEPDDHIWPDTLEDVAPPEAQVPGSTDFDAEPPEQDEQSALESQHLLPDDAAEIDLDADQVSAGDSASGDTEEPDFVTRSRRRQQRSRITRIFMSFASILLLFGLLAQGTYAFRDQLAAWFPQTKPGLAQLCQMIGCQVKLPAQIDMVSIESHELQALAADKNTFALTLLLRNRSPVTQAWPTIELTLNDGNEKPLARRMLTPRDYLSSEKEVTKGFAAQSEQPLKVAFELPQLTASGYRVYLFYP